LQGECDRLNADYRHWTQRREPWVILKLAMTLDGGLAVPGRRWVTGLQARAEVQEIRAGCDAILVGAETVRKDNPRLTVRNEGARCQPWRVVVTRSGKLPRSAKIFRGDLAERTLVYRDKKWDAILRELYARGVRRLLVEGGAKTAEGLLGAGKVNEVVLFFAPESSEATPVRVTGWAGWGWREVSVHGVGRDLCLRGTLKGAK
jgi:diaminohydroxyphosphoribosylaminopyrimidine deaminase/5-amino-6-(5-phosphoribosylamino)uracil reductase